MPGQTIHTAQEMTEVGSQGLSAEVEIGDHDESQLLKQGSPATVIGENAGVQHFRGGEDEIGGGLPNGAAFGDWRVAVVGGDG